MGCCMMKELAIKVVQGDTFNANIKVNNISHENIRAVYFSCQKLGINKELQYNSELDRYILKLTSEETEQHPNFYGEYDITIYFNGDNVKTAVYNASIEILDKFNKVDINDE